MPPKRKRTTTSSAASFPSAAATKRRKKWNCAAEDECGLNNNPFTPKDRHKCRTCGKRVHGILCCVPQTEGEEGRVFYCKKCGLPGTKTPTPEKNSIEEGDIPLIALRRRSTAPAARRRRTAPAAAAAAARRPAATRRRKTTAAAARRRRTRKEIDDNESDGADFGDDNRPPDSKWPEPPPPRSIKRQPKFPNQQGLQPPSQLYQYFGYLANFLEYRNKTEYPYNWYPSLADLIVIQPEDIYRYFAYRAYGTPDPGPHDRPQYLRRNTLEYWKKGISYFMPNKSQAWRVESDGRGFGNPTRSTEVNGLMKAVAAAESKGLGAKSKEGRSETNGTVCFDLMEPYEEGRDANEIGRNTSLWRSAMYARSASTHKMLMKLQNQLVSDLADLKRRLRTLEGITRAMLYRPASVAAGPPLIRQGTPGAPPSRKATLPSAPKSLALLWAVYENGVDGAKPAREFTKEERGAVKTKYCRWLPFWRCMDRLIRAGSDVNTAIRRIRTTYGYHLNITQLLLKIRDDEKNGGHGALRA